MYAVVFIILAWKYKGYLKYNKNFPVKVNAFEEVEYADVMVFSHLHILSKTARV